MKVQAKLGLLLFAMVATFVLGLIAVKAYERGKFRAVAAAREDERRKSFDDFIRNWSQSFEIFVRNFSAWTEMVFAVENANREWAEANLGEQTLVSYRAHAVWAYQVDGTLAFTRNILDSETIAEVPLPAGAMQGLLQNAPRCHFFARTPLGIMEIRGATVHPSNDSARQSPPRGTFFAGRLWSNADLQEMSLFTGNDIQLVEPGSAAAATPAQRGDPVVSFVRVLPGWDGKPLAALAVRNSSPVVEQLNRSSERLFLSLLAFALVLFLVLVFSLTQWVSRPLKKLSKCLKKNDLAYLQPLKDEHDEFGDLARLIADFFHQRESLLHEMVERRQTEQALHESEERLRHSQKMEAVGRLAGGVAHDFNNLLTAIIGYAELIGMQTTSEQTRQEAGLIQKAGEQAADLTRQLLAFSRKQILQPRILDLNTLVHEMQKLLQRVIGEHIELRVQTSAESNRVRADPTQLEQVIVNLGVNARDAMPRGGVLTMSTADALVAEEFGNGGGTLPPGRYVTLTVQDTGCGMDAQTKERIFEPFFTTKGPGKGTGLGLATVYGIVRQSGGAITVETKLGIGTTFTIYLPREDAPLEGAQDIAPMPASQRSGETLLIVEDETLVRELICTVLTDQGYYVLCARDGAEGLRLASEHEGAIELLITDVILPQMNGPEVALELQADRPEMKVLFVSGYSDNDISDQGVLAPDVRFLEKPFTPETLSRKVREVLDEPALERVG